MKLVISLHLEDLSTLEYINSVLKVGKLNIYRDNRSPTCKLVINRTDLQEIVFPLFLYNNIFFLTETRSDQFNLAMYILKNDIRTFDKIPKDIPASFELPKTPLDYTKLLFFRNWIVGFAMSEGSFFVKANNDGCFQLKQRIHINLFEAFKLVFDTNRKVETEKGLYNQFGVSSKSDIQKVIHFFSFSGLHPLVGRRLIEYLTWVDAIKKHHRIDSKKILHSSFLYSNQVIFWILYLIYIIIYCIYPEGYTILNDICLNLTPLVLYINADKDKVIAIKNNRKKSGIYRWTHKESGKYYIGSAVDLGRRFSNYFSYPWIISQAKSSIICKSLLKYGYSEFSLEIIEYCDIKDTIKREQFYIDSLNPEYNILKIAGSRLGSKHSAETKAKIVLALTGRKTSLTTKSKQRIARLGIPHDDATRAKLKEHLTQLNKNMLAKKKGIKVTVLDLETNITSEYDSIRKAAQSIGSYANVLIRYEKLQLDKGYTKPFKDRYVINIHRI